MADATPPAAGKPLCFVIGPIGEKGTDPHRDAEFLLEMVIRPALEADYVVKRADEDPDPGMISNAMILDITHADLVVADLTSLNPNALYELGIRHSTEKPVIHMAEAKTVPPFDNAGHRTIFFDLRDHRSISDTKAALIEAAARTRVPGYKVSNPITQANASFRMRESADPVQRVLADVVAKLDSIQGDLRARQAAYWWSKGSDEAIVGEIGKMASLINNASSASETGVLVVPTRRGLINSAPINSGPINTG